MNISVFTPQKEIYNFVDPPPCPPPPTSDLKNFSSSVSAKRALAYEPGIANKPVSRGESRGVRHKQGFVELYNQRLKEGNIVRQKLSRLKPHRPRVSRLRPHRLRLSRLYPIGWAKVHGLRLYRLKLYGSEAGGVQRNYILLYKS